MSDISFMAHLLIRLRRSARGLDHRRAGTHMGDLFGMGTYLAEDSSKSDIYAKPDAHGIKCMLVCRVCLGETYYTRQPPGISMPPDDRCDSVTALRLDEGGRRPPRVRRLRTRAGHSRVPDILPPRLRLHLRAPSQIRRVH